MIVAIAVLAAAVAAGSAGPPRSSPFPSRRQGGHRRAARPPGLLALGTPAVTASAALGLVGAGAWGVGPLTAISVGPDGSPVTSLTLVLAVLVPLGSAVLLRRRAAARRRRVRDRRREVELLRGVSAELAAGATPCGAVRAMADDADAPYLDPLAGAARDDHVEALTETLRSSPAPGLRALGAAYTVSGRTGAPLAELTARLAAATTRDAATAQEVRTGLAGTRTTARLLALLPLAGVVLAALSGADPVGVFLGSSIGRGCLLGGVVLDVIGLWWIELLADRAEP